MTKSSQRLADYLAHILEAIERIGSYTADVDKTTFLENSLIQDAVIRNLEVIGEASRNINKHCSEFSDAHPDIPFAYAYQMRNALTHGYFNIDFEIVWKTIQNDLPALYHQIILLSNQHK